MEPLLVGSKGFEPSTFCSGDRRFYPLSYEPETSLALRQATVLLYTIPTPNMSTISRNSRVYALPHRLHWSGLKDIAMNDFGSERRFYCRALPPELDDGEPMLIVQSYYVHDGKYALRVRLQTHGVRIDMNADTDPIAVLRQYRDRFTEAFVTVKGPSVGGTRYEAEREIDARIAAELVMRGGCPIIKNRFSAWIGEDGWSLDILGRRERPAGRRRGGA